MITYVHFNDTLPTTHLYPLHPETHRKWPERFAELVEVGKAYAAARDDVAQAELAAKHDALSDGLEFVVEPHFVLHHQKDVTVGYRRNGKFNHEPEQHVSCHSRTWRELSPAQKKLMTVQKGWKRS